MPHITTHDPGPLVNTQVLNHLQVDATVEKGLLHRFASIQGFPAIFHISEQETRQYDGKQTLLQVTASSL